jgi:CRP-like cAMP-binding protein
MTRSPVTLKVLESLEPQAITLGADRDEVIVARGNRAMYCFLVVMGCVRAVKLMNDGRRQICEFLLPGDLFGWDALDEYDFTAEAVTPLTLRRYIHGDLYALADRDRTFACWLRELMVEKLQAGREHTVLLGRQAAAERVSSFLREMAHRMNSDTRTLIELPMGRADIADYLGLTIETVCRRLTQLRRDGTISIDRANVVIRNPSALGVAGCVIQHRSRVLLPFNFNAAAEGHG